MEVSAKEKATELVDYFRVVLMNEDTECGNESLCTLISIKHAHIVCDMLIEELNEMEKLGSGVINNSWGQDDWLEVKRELDLI